MRLLACAGLYAGLAIGFLVGCPRFSARAFERLFGLSLVAMLVDIVLQDAGVHAPLHPIRLLTGALVGWTASAWIVSATASSRGFLEASPNG